MFFLKRWIKEYVSIQSFSKDKPAKQVKGNRYMYNCTTVFTIVTQFNFKLGHKLLNEVEYDVKDYANWIEWCPPQISVILHIIYKKKQITIIVSVIFHFKHFYFWKLFQKLWPFPSTVPGYLKAFFLACTSQKVDNIHPETWFACSCIPSSFSQKI